LALKVLVAASVLVVDGATAAGSSTLLSGAIDLGEDQTALRRDGRGSSLSGSRGWGGSRSGRLRSDRCGRRGRRSELGARGGFIDLSEDEWERALGATSCLSRLAALADILLLLSAAIEVILHQRLTMLLDLLHLRLDPTVLLAAGLSGLLAAGAVTLPIRAAFEHGGGRGALTAAWRGSVCAAAIAPLTELSAVRGGADQRRQHGAGGSDASLWRKRLSIRRSDDSNNKCHQ